MDTQSIILVLILVFVFIIAAVYSIIESRAKKQREAERIAQIERKRLEWGDEICSSLIYRRIAVGMTQDMVLLSWGKPSYVDQNEITSKSVKERWVYGIPRKGANYVWFVNRAVSKIKN